MPGYDFKLTKKGTSYYIQYQHTSSSSRVVGTPEYEWRMNYPKKLLIRLWNDIEVSSRNLLSSTFDEWQGGSYSGPIAVGDIVDYLCYVTDYTTGAESLADVLFHGLVVGISNQGDGTVLLECYDMSHKYEYIKVPQTWFSGYRDRVRASMGWYAGWIAADLPDTDGYFPGVEIAFACDDEVFDFGTNGDADGDGSTFDMNAAGMKCAAPFVAQWDGTWGYAFWAAWDGYGSDWTVRVGIQGNDETNDRPDGTWLFYRDWTESAGATGSNLVKGYWNYPSTSDVAWLEKGKKYWMVWDMISRSAGAVNIQRYSKGNYTDWSSAPRYKKDVGAGWVSGDSAHGNLKGGFIVTNYEVLDRSDYEYWLYLGISHKLRLLSLPGKIHPGNDYLPSYFGEHIRRWRLSYYYGAVGMDTVLAGLVALENSFSSGVIASYNMPLYRTRGKSAADCFRELMELVHIFQDPYWHQGCWGHIYSGGVDYLCTRPRRSLGHDTPVMTFAYAKDTATDNYKRIVSVSMQKSTKDRPSTVVVVGKAFDGTPIVGWASDRGLGTGSWYNKTGLRVTKTVYDESLTTHSLVYERAWAILQYYQRDVWEGRITVKGTYAFLVKPHTWLDGGLSGEVVTLIYSPLGISSQNFLVQSVRCYEDLTEIQITNRDVLYENYLMNASEKAYKSESFLSPDDPQETYFFMGHKQSNLGDTTLYMELCDGSGNALGTGPRSACTKTSNANYDTNSYNAYFTPGQYTGYVEQIKLYDSLSGGTLKDTFVIGTEMGNSYKFRKWSTTGAIVDLHYTIP